jgi:tripartite-type tricarboxylate transporter receptor subunit TctC
MEHHGMVQTTRRSLLQAAAALAGATVLAPLRAQGSYPDRPIKLLVPFPAGALTDAIGRLLADRLRPVLGQPFIVENRPGAGTLLGASVVAKSPPDGYQLMIATTTTLALSPAMFARPLATTADFVGVAMIGTVTLMLVTRPNLKVHSLPELVAAMRAAPGRFSFGSPGNGTMHHVLVEMLMRQEKLTATHVPYQGSMTALTDVMTGRLDFMFLDAVAAMPQIRAGKVNVIAVAAGHRYADLPEVPTVAESYPLIDVQAWQSVAAPKATPMAIVERLNHEINKQLELPEVRAQLLNMGVDANPMPVTALNALIAKDAQRLGALVHAIGLTAR